MRVLCVIPARRASTRFPGKMLHPVLGRPLIAWVVTAVRNAKRPDETIVATDDREIADVARKAGARAVMTRADHPSGTDRVAEAAAAASDDIVINVQGDEPLIRPESIDDLARCMLEDASLDMATAACPIRDMAELNARTVVKVVMTRENRALFFSRLPIPCRRDGSPELVGGDYLRHIGIYAYRGEFLRRLVAEAPCWMERCESLEQLRALYLGARMKVLRVESAGVGVDVPDDVHHVETLMLERERCAITS